MNAYYIHNLHCNLMFTLITKSKQKADLKTKKGYKNNFCYIKNDEMTNFWLLSTLILTKHTFSTLDFIVLMAVLLSTVILVSFARSPSLSLFISAFKSWRWASILSLSYKKELSNELLNKLSHVLANLTKNAYSYNIKFF